MIMTFSHFAFNISMEFKNDVKLATIRLDNYITSIPKTMFGRDLHFIVTYDNDKTLSISSEEYESNISHELIDSDDLLYCKTVFKKAFANYFNLDEPNLDEPIPKPPTEEPQNTSSIVFTFTISHIF